jgi:hypothetical protein
VHACRDWHNQVQAMPSSEQAGMLLLETSSMQQGLLKGVEKAMEVLRLLLSAAAHKQCQHALLLFQGYTG